MAWITLTGKGRLSPPQRPAGWSLPRIPRAWAGRPDLRAWGRPAPAHLSPGLAPLFSGLALRPGPGHGAGSRRPMDHRQEPRPVLFELGPADPADGAEGLQILGAGLGHVAERLVVEDDVRGDTLLGGELFAEARQP